MKQAQKERRAEILISKVRGFNPHARDISTKEFQKACRRWGLRITWYGIKIAKGCNVYWQYHRGKVSYRKTLLEAISRARTNMKYLTGG